MDSDEEILARVIRQARANGWWAGEIVLAALENGNPFDCELIVRGMFMNEEFARYFWKDSRHPEQHLLGMELVENPLSYLALYV